jgi:glycosyltransferase involved in cell wall biosynthesis
VADRLSLERIRSWGLENVFLVRPGIDTSRFTHSPLPLPPDAIRLMVGSAPWSRAQFRSKGVLTLLEAAQQMPRLQLVFLWRGVLTDKMEQLVRRMGLNSQVEVLNQKVDVNQVLSSVHASITLATDPAVIRPYPHSLMESLAAGKPVVISEAIPMSSYVKEQGCGTVVGRVTPDEIVAAVEMLARDYDRFQHKAQRVGPSDFSQEAMIASYERVYQQVLAGA